MNIGKAIRVIMEEQDLQILSIREKTGWSKSYISNVRQAKADAMPRLSEWARLLGITEEELITRARQYHQEAA